MITGSKPESDSISNQKSLILEYLKSRPEIQIVSIREDDGYTGTDFNRPAVQAMLEDVKKGVIDCIIVKDACVIIEPTRKGPFERLSWPGSICF